MKNKAVLIIFQFAKLSL